MYLFILAKIFNLLLPPNMKADDLSILLKPMLEYKLHNFTIVEWRDFDPDEDELDSDHYTQMDYKPVRMLS